MTNKIKIFSLGTDALTIEFGNEVSETLNRKVLKLAGILEKNPFGGFIEIVPAYASLSIFYDVLTVKKPFRLL